MDTLSSNGWYQSITRNQCPTQGCDVHAAIDTAGFMYTFGGCLYGNNAGGTHSNEVLRFKVAGDSIGWVDKLYACNAPGNPWHGSCQAGQAYDSRRNCVWISNVFGGLGSCQSGSSATAQLYKFQCPNGPVTLASSRTLISNYLRYDPVNDMLIGVNSNGGGIIIYNIAANTQRAVAYPYPNTGRTYEVPCCVDTKRGLFVLTQWSSLPTKVNAVGDTVLDTARLVKDVWFLNPATATWTKKTPPTYPWMWNAELAYDPVHDKYLFFGSTYSCRWGSRIAEVWAYDYDSNTWTRMPDNGRRFNPSNPALSTWPAFRFKHSWEYSKKSNAFVTWGHTTYGDCSNPLYSDEALKTPLWLYRYDTSRTAAAEAPSVIRESDIDVGPNPFSASVTIKAAGGLRACAVFDLTGKLVFRPAISGSAAVWNGRNSSGRPVPEGIYVVRVRTVSGMTNRKIILMR